MKQVERRTAKAHRPKTDALPLDHVTNRELLQQQILARSHKCSHKISRVKCEELFRMSYFTLVFN